MTGMRNLTDEELWGELWRDVKDYEGQYRISDKGRLYSIKSERILDCMTNHGYKMVVLGWGVNKRKAGIHQLVAETFLPHDPTRPHVNHIDGNPANNHCANLEYVTPGENQLHAYRTGLRQRMAGERHFGAKITEEDVRFIRSSKGKLPLKKLAEKYNLNWKYVWNIQNGFSWKHVL